MKQCYAKHYTFWICLGLVLVTLVAYEPIRHNDFINYDDEIYIYENPHIADGLTWDSVKWAFTSTYTGNWHPVTWLSHMVDYQLFGLNPQGHHLMNLLFHLANTLLLFGVLKSMTRAIWPSAFVAAAFALHPLHVETVAWAAERKDVLSTFFWLGTMAAYVRYARGPGIGKYIGVVLIFAVGLMAKPMLVTLPFVLLLLDGWPLGRVQWPHSNSGKSQSLGGVFAQASWPQLIKEKIPLFSLVVASCIVTYIAQRSGGAVTSLEVLSVKYRIANALVSYVGYINKMVYPRDLAVLYPLAVKLITMQQLIFCLLTMAVMSAVVVYLSRRHGYLAMGWLWYLGTLVPVIGLVQVGRQSMADRYTYIPLIGIFIMVAWGIGEILAKWRFRNIFLGILASIILITIAIGTRRQVGYWQNSFSLFGHTLNITQNNYTTHNNLGSAHIDLERYQEGIDACKQAIRIKPGYAKAHLNLGVAYFHLNRHTEAIDACKQAISIERDFADAYKTLGVSYAAIGLNQDAIGAYKYYLRINPDNEKVHLNLGIAYGKMGLYQDEVEACKQAIRIQPDNAQAYYNLGNAYSKLNRYQKAIDAYQQTIRIKPGYAEAYKNMGVVYFNLNRYPDAIDAYQQAVSIKPDYAEAYLNLGVACFNLSRHQEALDFCKQAISVKPDYTEAYINLGIIYTQLGRYEEAKDAYKQAVRIKPDYAEAHLGLGIIHFLLGDKSSALDEYELLKELDMGRAQELSGLINQ